MLKRQVKMNQKTNVIKKNDYEKYEILIPFSNVAGKKEKQYLCAELEKRHPCFSDEYEFDKVLKRITKKGLYSDVLVINKHKLAEYEGKRTFAGTGFFVDEEKKENGVRLKHRFFITAKWKLTRWSIIAILSVIITGVLSGIYAGSSSRIAKNNQSSIASSTTASEITLSEIIPEVNNLSEKKCVQDLFEIISTSNGKISSFEWSMNGYIQHLKVNISRVFPEQLLDYEKYIEDSVIYENGAPRFTIDFSSRIEQIDLFTSTEAPVLTNSDFNKEIRNVILKYGGELKVEKAPPYHIEYVCHEENQQQLLFRELAEIIRTDNRTATEILITKCGLNELRVGLTVEVLPFFTDVFDLEEIAENLHLFIDEKKSNFNTHYSPQNKTEKRTDKNVIIGEIKRPDNSTIIFYKDSEGKIRQSIQ